MKNQKGNFYKPLTLTLGLLLLLLSTASALGIVWVRKHIMRVAQANKTVELQLEKLHHRRSYLEGEMARVNNPEALKQRALTVLAMPSSRQIVWAKPQRYSKTVATTNAVTENEITFRLAASTLTLPDRVQ